MLSDAGFTRLTSEVCRVRSTGIVILAPVCASWSWMSRSSTGRSLIEPLGSDTSPSAIEGNEMVSRVIMVLKLIIARGCIFVLEQPSGSLMSQHPRFQTFLGDHSIWKVSVRAWNVDVAKSLCLVRCSNCIDSSAGLMCDRFCFRQLARNCRSLFKTNTVACRVINVALSSHLEGEFSNVDLRCRVR
jgi:hypothetical protein